MSDCLEEPLMLEEDSMEEAEKEDSGDDHNVEERESNIDEDDDIDIKEKVELDEDTDVSEDSESEENDSLDEGVAEERRNRYVFDMNELEHQFGDLKEQLFKERITQIEEQLKQVNNSEAQEYTGPLKQLEDECISRNQVAGHLKHFKTFNLENELKCELQSAEQHFQNEERRLIASLKRDVKEKQQKIEEERYSSDMYSDLWFDDTNRYYMKRKGGETYISDKRKKPVTVTGPFIVYMLKELDILDDWAVIRKAKYELKRRIATAVPSKEKDIPITARYEDGKVKENDTCAF